MPRFTIAGIQRSIEIVAGVSMLALPRRLQWSRRSSRVLAGTGLGLAGFALGTGIMRGGGGRLARPVSAYGDIIAGLVLIGLQYELTDEESSVRGYIAGIGAALILLGLVAKLFSARARMRGVE